MTIRVMRTDGQALSFRQSLRRLVGMVLAALPLLAGYLLILVDDRRRGLHDRFAGTLVVFLTEEEREARRGAAAAGLDQSSRQPVPPPAAPARRS
jgi:uncharacterized RDD family membrane protein YckC